ncbi:hypothetical protein G7054_g7580 [Neopestalotiopsis clavispora]|nr:hypothetical protein G7054_g7580 [Neopestalotiopsis clavispora]
MLDRNQPKIWNYQRDGYLSLEDPEVRPTRDEATSTSKGTSKKPGIFALKRWRKSFRYLRVVAWIFAFVKSAFIPMSYDFWEDYHDTDIWNRFFSTISWEILFASLFIAWDIWRIVQSLYERPPGYRTEIILVIEICIMIASILDVAKDLSFFSAMSIPAYIALIALPAALLSMCIVGGHVWRYPAKRRERIRYAKIKPQLAFTASGIPVAVYPTRGMFGASEMDLLSVDSLQEHPDSQADQLEHHHNEFHDATGYTNESQVSLLSDRATTSFATHDEIRTAVHRPIQNPQWSEEYSR